MFQPPDAPAFFEMVWDITRQIPPGMVSSYGQIASIIPPVAENHRRLAPRWVGTAMRKTPSGLGIPWQRVINSAGRISFPAGSAKAKQQQRLLEAEGIEFDKSGKVDLGRFGWRGPSADYLRKNRLLPPKPLT